VTVLLRLECFQLYKVCSHTVIPINGIYGHHVEVNIHVCTLFVSTLDNVVAKYAASFENSLIVDKGTEAHPTSKCVIFA